jgi:hypothetical protein
MPRRLLPALLGLLALAAFAGCDTDNPSSPLEEIEGVYVFTELRFDPTASAIADADVLERLVAANTNVEIFGVGPALIRFQFEGAGEPVQRADANVTATSSTVRLTPATEGDAALLLQLLFPVDRPLALSRDSDERLSGEVATTADLEAFDPEVYAGVPPLPGTLRVTLEREDGGGR